MCDKRRTMTYVTDTRNCRFWHSVRLGFAGREAVCFQRGAGAGGTEDSVTVTCGQQGAHQRFYGLACYAPPQCSLTGVP